MGKLFLIVALFASHLLFQSDKYSIEREKMIKAQIISRGITDTSVIEAMHSVPRHEFVPDHQIPYAYQDRPLAIGHGQTISQPYIVAYMTQLLQLQKHHKVLEIGTGSGYQAAILSGIISQVFTIEIVEPLGQKAKERLKKLGYDNIAVKIGDGYNGWSEEAPFDAIIVTAAPEKIPPPLVEQLKEGGKMIIPVGSQYYTQYLVLVEKRKGKIKKQKVLPVRFVPFTRQQYSR